MAEVKTVEDKTVEEKVAAKQPAGSTEYSGASGGMKADDGSGTFSPDESQTFEKPKAAVKAEERALEIANEVRDIQLVAHEKTVTSVPDYPIVTAYANRPDKGDPESITFVVTGGEVAVIATAKEMRFGREEAAALQRAASRIAGTL